MAIDCFDLYNDFCSRVNTFQGGNFRLQEDFIRNVNAIYYDIWDRETRNARKSQQSRDNCLSFLVSKNIMIPKSIYARYSVLQLPKDYGRFSSARIVLQRVKNDDTKIETIPSQQVDKGKCKGYKKIETKPIDSTNIEYEISEIPIELINDDQWGGCLSDLIKYPKLSSPKMVQIDNGFQIAPKDISVVVFSYYKMPLPATMSLTYTEGDDQNGNGDELIYNQSKSTPIMFPNNLKNEFLWKLGEIYGYYTREQFLSAFANEKGK